MSLICYWFVCTGSNFSMWKVKPSNWNEKLLDSYSANKGIHLHKNVHQVEKNK